MNNHNTHLLQHFPTKKRSILSRNLDGVIIAVREGQRVAVGEDPRNQDQKAFVDEDRANAFLRRIADLDQNMVKGNRCKICGDAPQVRIRCISNSGEHQIEHDPIARVEEVEGEPRITLQ